METAARLPGLWFEYAGRTQHNALRHAPSLEVDGAGTARACCCAQGSCLCCRPHLAVHGLAAAAHLVLLLEAAVDEVQQVHTGWAGRQPAAARQVRAQLSTSSSGSALRQHTQMVRSCRAKALVQDANTALVAAAGQQPPLLTGCVLTAVFDLAHKTETRYTTGPMQVLPQLPLAPTTAHLPTHARTHRPNQALTHPPTRPSTQLRTCPSAR